MSRLPPAAAEFSYRGCRGLLLISTREFDVYPGTVVRSVCGSGVAIAEVGANAGVGAPAASESCAAAFFASAVFAGITWPYAYGANATAKLATPNFSCVAIFILTPLAVVAAQEYRARKADGEQTGRNATHGITPMTAKRMPTRDKMRGGERRLFR
jgi:hypothetical protein